MACTLSIALHNIIVLERYNTGVMKASWEYNAGNRNKAVTMDSGISSLDF